MSKIEWPLLQPEDIEVKICSTKDGVTTLLLYQDARCTMEAFDTKFGPENWQIEYKAVGDQVYGSLSVYDEHRGIWIRKEDTGDKSNISEDKGQSSDILKRCAVRWGFARELYSTPRINIPASGQRETRRFRVKTITYDDRRQCSSLVIVDGRGNEVFSWTQGQETPYSQSQASVPQQTPMQALEDFFRRTKNISGVNRDELVKFKDYYKAKMDTWSGLFDADRLWGNWMKRAAAI